MAKKRRKLPTRRIYYGPPGAETSLWWNVTTTPAKQNVIIDGNVKHALEASEGETIGCGLSNVAYDNAEAFPHQVYLAAFSKTGAMIVSRTRKNGEPAHAVVYAHSYGHITDANDTGTLKKMVKESPDVMERSFTLRVPRKNKPSGKTAHGRGGGGGVGVPRGQMFVPRGALARAVRAGRMNAAAAQQLKRVARKAKKEPAETEP